MDAAAVGGAFLSAFLQVLLDRLASPHLVNFIYGNKVDANLIQRLKNTLYAVEAVLNDAELKQIKDSAVNNWLDDLKDALYIADDILDHISTKAATTHKNKEVCLNKKDHVIKFIEENFKINSLERSILVCGDCNWRDSTSALLFACFMFCFQKLFKNLCDKQVFFMIYVTMWK